MTGDWKSGTGPLLGTGPEYRVLHPTPSTTTWTSPVFTTATRDRWYGAIVIAYIAVRCCHWCCAVPPKYNGGEASARYFVAFDKSGGPFREASAAVPAAATQTASLSRSPRYHGRHAAAAGQNRAGGGRSCAAGATRRFQHPGAAPCCCIVTWVQLSPTGGRGDVVLSRPLAAVSPWRVDWRGLPSATRQRARGGQGAHSPPPADSQLTAVWEGATSAIGSRDGCTFLRWGAPARHDDLPR